MFVVVVEVNVVIDVVVVIIVCCLSFELFLNCCCRVQRVVFADVLKMMKLFYNCLHLICTCCPCFITR